ncbi:MAG TPA: rhomboid family intramembrane serine protease [Polyangiaceae bacterium]|jgi:membrane associated rhomboid family serine protease|nr:rhomboid family intramembrane serine protease [Polyangiaceae bacterium]
MPEKKKASGEWAGLKRELKLQAIILFGFVALLWAIEIVDQVVFRGALDNLGVRPRSLVGLPGILLAPFLHGGFAHLMANSVSLLLLGWLVMLRETRDFFVVAVLGTLVGGIGIWLIGPSGSIHIGASIVVFAMLGYLLLRGWFDRRFWPIAGSVVIGLLYGGMLFGMLPGQAGISWEGHLFGFVGGGLAARLLGPRTSPKV